MNRYILIRRLRGPAILLLLGTILLMHQAGMVDFWSSVLSAAVDFDRSAEAG